MYLPIALLASNGLFIAPALLVALLVVFTAWKLWRHRLAVVQPITVTTHTDSTTAIHTDHHVVSHMPRFYSASRKHNGSSMKQENPKHAYASSSRAHPSRSVHDNTHNRETDNLLSPRAVSQKNYSGTSTNRQTSRRHQSTRSVTDSINSSRILPGVNKYEEPDSINQHHTESSSPHYGGSRLTPKNNNIVKRNSKQNLKDPEASVIISIEEFDDLLQKNIQQILKQTTPVDPTRWAPRPVDTPGRRYRELAREASSLRKFAFESAKQAKKAGKWGDVKKFTDEGKRHDENVKQYNKLAADEIFRAWNPKRSLTKCDLHGLHVEESLEYASQHLIACRSAGVEKTMLIVGKGSHSQPGGPRIGPAILEMLRNTGGVVAGAHENNSGAIVVEFSR